MARTTPAGGADLWERLRSVAPLMLRALLADMRLVSLEAGRALLACEPVVRSLAAGKLDDLSKLMSSVAGEPIRAVLTEAPGPDATQADGLGDQAVGPRVSPSGADPMDEPLVRRALELFGGRVIEVKGPPRAAGPEE